MRVREFTLNIKILQTTHIMNTSSALILCLLPLAWANLETAVQSNTNFSRQMYASVSNGTDNLVISPLSAQMVLGMLRLGSRNRTELQISQALSLDHVARNESNLGLKDLSLRIQEENADNGTTISIANKMYVAKGLELYPEFQEEAEEYFCTQAEEISFKNASDSVEIINNWIQNATYDKIKDLLSPDAVNDDTQLVLVNTLYFRSLWRKPFDAMLTENRTFYISPENPIKIPFMQSTGEFDIANIPEINASIAVLPYEGETLSFVIISPNSLNGLPELEESMLEQDLNDLLNKTEPNSIKIFIPSFTITHSVDLKEPFKQMGMIDMFEDEADLTGIAKHSKNFRVDKVAQKTFIEVTESGTEAASATFASIVDRFAGGSNFIVDRPFLFYIVARPIEDQTVILFSGRFTKP